jgi:hypothetical protein
LCVLLDGVHIPDDPKPREGRDVVVRALQAMTPDQRLRKAMELSRMARDLLWEGLCQTRPDLDDAQRRALFLERLARCHNQNW